MESTIRLFKALPIKVKKHKNPSNAMLSRTLKRGFIFAPEVIANYSAQELYDVIDTVEKEFGLTPEQMNQTLHASWDRVANAPILDLVLDQLTHYFTTYGYESLGIYSDSTVYVPRKDLNIPEMTEDFKIVVIRGYTREELKEKLLVLLESGIALKEQTKKDVVDVATFVDIAYADIDRIRNREVTIELYDALGLVPENPVEFLRYLIFKTTGKTLLIKNPVTVKTIKEGAGGKANIVYAIRNYKKTHGLERLASIFRRYKPLFLAFKVNSNMIPYINKLNKLAMKHHKPMPRDFLNDVTGIMSRDEYLDLDKLESELKRVNIWRKIRLYNALNYRSIDEPRAILFKIRNSKSYAKKFSVEHTIQLPTVMTIVADSIIADIKKNVYGKKIYIPDGIEYALPATEKQFTGNLPSGTSVSVPRDAIIGIHWENLKGKPIDIDLKLHAVGLSLGWNNTWRTDKVLFSGDLTSAPKPNGATELYYLKECSKGEDEHYIMIANYFNFRGGEPVAMKILVAQEKPRGIFDRRRSDNGNPYMINPNNVACVAKTVLDVKQKILGLVVVSSDKITFYFNESDQGDSIVSSRNEHVMLSRQYLFDYCTNSISLNDILKKAGAILVEDKEEVEVDIDLSPEVIEKDTIISLLTEVKKK